MNDYFALFALPHCFDVDASTLEKRYFTLQRQAHPDIVSRRGPMERQAAAQTTIRLNDAYQTLRSPLKRAQYLLTQHGIRVGTEQDSVKPGIDILTESMEWREALAEAGSQMEIESLRGKLAQAREACLRALSDAFDREAWNEAAQHALRLGYLEKALEETRRMRFSAAAL